MRSHLFTTVLLSALLGFGSAARAQTPALGLVPQERESTVYRLPVNNNGHVALTAVGGVLIGVGMAITLGAAIDLALPNRSSGLYPGLGNLVAIGVALPHVVLPGAIMAGVGGYRLTHPNLRSPETGSAFVQPVTYGEAVNKVENGRTLRMIGGVLFGAGLIATVAGAAMAGYADHDYTVWPGSSKTDFYTASYTLAVGGAFGLLVPGLTMLSVGQARVSKYGRLLEGGSSERASYAARLNLRVAPQLTPQSAGLSLAGAF